MRLSVVRLVFAKEVRDLVRDRRTVMLVLVMPAVLYPLFGIAGFAIARTLLHRKTVIGVVGRANLPAEPALLDGGAFRGKPLADEANPESKATPLVAEDLSDDPSEALRTKRVDVVLLVPPGFAEAVADPKKPRPTVTVLNRDGDELSKLGARKLVAILTDWEDELRASRFAAAGFDKSYGDIFELDDPLSKKPPAKKAADELRDNFVKVFPFILIMWLVAGSIQPAVDTTAGERERGTMETLLISPTSRAEIVVGKWLATTLFGFTSVFWNVLWLAGAAIALQFVLGSPIVNLPGLIGCVVLGLPLAMLFAACALALGVYAKSTKEGQYYLIPLMLVTMPLAFVSLLPGRELTAGTAAVPITGAMLFQQKLLSTTADPIPWGLAPVIAASLVAVIAVALALAIRQFRREGVLFRDSAGRK